MKKLLYSILVLLFALPLLAFPIPRVFVQKLILDDGSLPQITQEPKKSANEYTLRAWMEAEPDEVISTDTHPINTIAVKIVGKEGIMPPTAIVNIQLGNFKRLWQAGDILHLVITHKKSGESKGWTLVVPEGTHLIKKLDEPVVIPPYSKKKK